MLTNPPVVAVALLALELGENVDTVASRLGDHIITDTVGFRTVDVRVAAELLAERAARQQTERERALVRSRTERARRAEMAERSRLDRARIRALKAKPQIGSDGGDPSENALATVLSGADYERRMERVGERNARLMAGESHGATFPGGIRQE